MALLVMLALGAAFWFAPGPMFRWFAGLPLDGKPRTDATFLHAAEHKITRKRVGAWGHHPGWYRSMVRNGSILGVAAGYWLIINRPRIVYGLAVAALAVVGALAVVTIRRRAWYRRYPLAIHKVLGPALGLTPTIDAADYIEVPRTFTTDEKTPVILRLPEKFSPTVASKELVEQIVLGKLGRSKENTDVAFESVGHPIVKFTMAPQPPDRVNWADNLAIMEALKPGQLFVGLGARNKPYIRDFNEGEIVHGGFNGQTGSGKSNMVMGWVAQILHTDPEAQVTFVDPKRSSLPKCLVGVPNYTLANNADNVEEMWNVITVFEKEMDRRQELRENDPTLEFPLMFLILDELSEFADLSAEYWLDIKEKNDPKTAKIWRSISRIMRMGREFGCRVLVFTQRLDSRSTGGFGLRDLLGWRGLCKFKKNHWMMLVGTTPVPKAINHVGRWIYTDGDHEKWVQNVYGTDQEFRDWATARRVYQVPSTTDVPAYGAPRAELGTGLGTGLLVGNDAAADYLGISVNTFNQRRKRAELVPAQREGNRPAWTLAELDTLKEKAVN